MVECLNQLQLLENFIFSLSGHCLHRLTAQIAILVFLPIFTVSCYALYAAILGWAWFAAQQ
jgi:hypothetical protein